jgi:hypothetical protein
MLRLPYQLVVINKLAQFKELKDPVGKQIYCFILDLIV